MFLSDQILDICCIQITEDGSGFVPEQKILCRISYGEHGCMAVRKCESV